MTVLAGISGWGLALLNPTGLYAISHHRCHTAHAYIQFLKVVSRKVSRENRRKPKFIMFK